MGESMYEERECEIRCQYCGVYGFEWDNSGFGWQLIDTDTGRVHRCTQMNRAKRKPKRRRKR